MRCPWIIAFAVGPMVLAAPASAQQQPWVAAAPQGPIACEAQETAGDFLATQAAQVDWIPQQVHRVDSRTYVHFRQVSAGQEVLGSFQTVVLDETCEVVLHTGKALAMAALAPPLLSPAEARARVASLTEGYSLTAPQLFAAVQGTQAQWMYHVPTQDGGILVDAMTGWMTHEPPDAMGHLGEKTQLKALFRTPLQRARKTTTGIGYVYRTDPEAGSYEEVALPRLYGDGSLLEGVYAQVTSLQLNLDGRPIAGINQTADYRYLPNLDDIGERECIVNDEVCSLFDATNVYYHIDHFAHTFWKEQMGYEVPFQAISAVHAHGDVALAKPDALSTTFGMGDIFFKNTSKKDDLIYHEYTHLITHVLGLTNNITTPLETRALSEAYSDYFTATFTQDGRLGEWVITCPDRQHCVGPPDDTEVRNLNSDPSVWNWQFGSPSSSLKYGVCTRYHEGDTKCKTSHLTFTDQYVWAMIFGSALWDLRKALGATVTDQLVFNGLLLVNGGTTTFGEAIDGLFLADGLLYESRHARQIEAVFRERGFERANIHVAQETEATLPITAQIFSNYPNPFAASTTLRITLPQAATVSLVVYDALGRAVETLLTGPQQAGEQDVLWQASTHPPGLYVARLTAGTQVHAWPLLKTR